MTYCLYDARGYVGDLASVHGLELISDFATRVTNEPQIKKFFQEGQAPITKELIAGFKAIHSSDKNIADTIDNLVNLLAECVTPSMLLVNSLFVVISSFKDWEASVYAWDKAAALLATDWICWVCSSAIFTL